MSAERFRKLGPSTSEDPVKPAGDLGLLDTIH
ncbi:hypothetical protein CLV49_0556 [Labedella gwakjiensis]|uniref:Uncharacterized protein n=1 Tax=Labedella gwakjiensis TaxID=390269 RepID=A0A2P8GSM1_9MICO|nr:hypothetical protein CLV49_0556 [Labedella gwakjiensis]